MCEKVFHGPLPFLESSTFFRLSWWSQWMAILVKTTLALWPMNSWDFSSFAILWCKRALRTDSGAVSTLPWERGPLMSTRQLAKRPNESRGREGSYSPWSNEWLLILEISWNPLKSGQRALEHFPQKYIFIKFCVQSQGFVSALKGPKDLTLCPRQRHRPLRRRRKYGHWSCQTKQ